MATHLSMPYPLGALWDGLGVNFAIYSEHAEQVDLLLFDHAAAHEPERVFTLPERTGPIWHGYVRQLRPGQLYGYRVHGPYAPDDGHYFNAAKLLLDPYAKAIGRPLVWDDSLFGYALGSPNGVYTRDDRSSAPYAPLGMVIEEGFEWGDDRRPHIPWEETIIYETHVRGLTRLHPEVREDLRGTFLGVATDPILDHLLALGITTVQVMPVQAFVQHKHLLDRGLRNYWGYDPIAYFAPEPHYCAAGGESPVRQFKSMVRTLHAAGLEVIMDVVYNHTGEGNHLGPTLCFRGIDNASYYKLTPDKPHRYMDYTGTGNTLDPAAAHVLQLIMDSLRYWVEQMHVDGFRFDLASALARELFDVNMLSAFFKVIQQDPVISQVKLIAEPWDVGPGGYQVGNFPWQWIEWNGRFRDTARSYWRGDPGQVGQLATRVTGSSDLYERTGRRPYASINFVTAHDGFTLNDLVSYDSKHNEANLLDNTDGESHNISTNCGAEGPTEDPVVIERREALKRCFVGTLLFSQGVPMLVGGDELSRTQHGNNNGFCQDNELSWYHWDLDERQRRFLELVRSAIALRQAHPAFRRRSFLRGEGQPDGCKDVTWWHPAGREMLPDDWHNANQRALGMLLCGEAISDLDRHGARVVDNTFFLILNANRKVVNFDMPPTPQPGIWAPVWGTTAQPSTQAHRRPGQRLRLPPISITLFALAPDRRERRSGATSASPSGWTAPPTRAAARPT